MIKNSRRYVQTKKLNLEAYGIPGRYLTAKEISELGLVTLSHAYRIIAAPDKHLSAQVKELLVIKVLGQIPGWQPGWRFDSAAERIYTPDGKSLTCAELENFAFAQQLLSLWEIENRDKTQQLEQQEIRIKELENRLKLPAKLRLYVNDSLKERRRLDINKPILKAV